MSRGQSVLDVNLERLSNNEANRPSLCGSTLKVAPILVLWQEILMIRRCHIVLTGSVKGCGTLFNKRDVVGGLHITRCCRYFRSTTSSVIKNFVWITKELSKPACPIIILFGATCV